MTGARIDLIHELVSSAAADSTGPAGDHRARRRGDHVRGVRPPGRSVAAWVPRTTRRGDRVAVIADNGASYARLYYGVPRSGAC